jgi:FkbM family methyltransferase
VSNVGLKYRGNVYAEVRFVLSASSVFNNFATSWRKRKNRALRSALEAGFSMIWRTRRRRQIGLRQLFDQHLVPGTLCLVPMSDHVLFVDPRDDKIGLGVLHGKVWEKREFDRVLTTLQSGKALRPSGIFVDVGANIGSITVQALVSGGFARAIAIEPDPHNFAILKRNIAINGLSDRVHLVHAAAGSQAGQATLVKDRRNLGAHSVLAHAVPSPGERITTPVYRLDDIIEQAGVRAADIALIKIDVEGHELEVLEGMPRLRAASVPLMFEYLGALHGQAGYARLQHLLASSYGQAAIIASDVASDVSAGVTSLAGLSLGTREYDVLAFALGSAAQRNAQPAAATKAAA